MQATWHVGRQRSTRCMLLEGRFPSHLPDAAGPAPGVVDGGTGPTRPLSFTVCHAPLTLFALAQATSVEHGPVPRDNRVTIDNHTSAARILSDPGPGTWGGSSELPAVGDYLSCAQAKRRRPLVHSGVSPPASIRQPIPIAESETTHYLPIRGPAFPETGYQP